MGLYQINSFTCINRCVYIGNVMPLTLVVASCNHVMPTTLSMPLSQVLGNRQQNEMLEDFFGHVMQWAPALASCGADNTINGIIASLRSRQMK